MPLIGLAAAFFTVMGFSLSGENLEKIEYPWIHVELNYGASSGTSPEPNKTIIDHVEYYIFIEQHRLFGSSQLTRYSTIWRC